MNIVIWIQGVDQNGGGLELLNPAANILARLYDNIDLIGVITPPGITLDKIRNINKKDLKNLDYDLILVTGRNVSLAPVLKEAKDLGLDENKIVLDRTICVPNFTLEKYKKLRHSQLSILSMNCFGGLCYHRFGLPFLSPTINMFFYEKDFLSFLKNPIKNLSENPIFNRTEVERIAKNLYPVLSLGENVELHMNHYPDAETAIRTWQNRTSRVNFFNLLVIMFTKNPEVLNEFDKLPYAKKVCFVPFKSNLESAFYLDVSKYNVEFWRIVNESAIGHLNFYDMWDMLLYGKKTPLNIQIRG